MTCRTITTTIAEGVLTLSLNRLDRLNACDRMMMDGMLAGRRR